MSARPSSPPPGPSWRPRRSRFGRAALTVGLTVSLAASAVACTAGPTAVRTVPAGQLATASCIALGPAVTPTRADALTALLDGDRTTLVVALRDQATRSDRAAAAYRREARARAHGPAPAGPHPVAARRAFVTLLGAHATQADALAAAYRRLADRLAAGGELRAALGTYGTDPALATSSHALARATAALGPHRALARALRGAPACTPLTLLS